MAIARHENTESVESSPQAGIDLSKSRKNNIQCLRSITFSDKPKVLSKEPPFHLHFHTWFSKFYKRRTLGVSDNMHLRMHSNRENLGLKGNNLEVSTSVDALRGQMFPRHAGPHDCFRRGERPIMPNTSHRLLMNDPSLSCIVSVQNPHDLLLLGYGHTYLTGDCRSLLVRTSTTPDTFLINDSA